MAHNDTRKHTKTGNQREVFFLVGIRDPPSLFSYCLGREIHTADRKTIECSGGSRLVLQGYFLFGWLWLNSYSYYIDHPSVRRAVSFSTFLPNPPPTKKVHGATSSEISYACLVRRETVRSSGWMGTTAPLRAAIRSELRPFWGTINYLELVWGCVLRQKYSATLFSRGLLNLRYSI